AAARASPARRRSAEEPLPRSARRKTLKNPKRGQNKFQDKTISSTPRERGLSLFPEICSDPFLADVLAEELQGSFARLLCRRLVVRAALVAVEAVVRRVDEDLVLLVLLGELLHSGDRDHRVLLAEVRHHRHLGLDVGVVENAAAVVGGRRDQAARLRRRHPGDEAAPAIADDPDLAAL